MNHTEPVEITIDNLLAKLRHYYPTNFKLINEAFTLAYNAHNNQFRASGRPYITHPVVVADILVDLGLDAPTICAALLHDTVEDTYVTDEMLRKEFGDEIADLVKGVTKLDKIQFRSKEEEQAENIRKMFFAMAKDIRVLIIKLADRLHNMRSLQYLSPKRQAIMARETLDIYGPLAGRLGISPIKCELEDLALKFLDRPAYDAISSAISLKREERSEIVETLMMRIRKLLADMGVEGEVSGRMKHFYSIYKKMNTHNKTIEQIYDLTAVRVIVDTVQDCYNVLGIIHSRWIPMPGRVKDYIAAPKSNLYQSLHTTVIASNATPIEIQIRTKEMHKIAEFGIAAHWKYKENYGGQSSSKMDDNLKWVQEVLNYGSALSDSHEFLDIIRKDIRITNEVYVFTPKGDVQKIMQGGTALDFAYAIHSEVGNKCMGAKVNGKITPLDTVLETGDVVEILTNPNSKGPSRDWLRIVKTSGAKSKIRQFFKREMKDEYISMGKTMLENEIKARGFSWATLMTQDAVNAVFERYSYTNIDEMYASIGYGGISVHQIVMKLMNYTHVVPQKTTQGKPLNPELRKNDNAVIVKGYENPLVRFSMCCAPVPGDKIVGYISHGRGITIHRDDCHSLKGLEAERLIEAEWAEGESNATFLATVQIISESKGDVFADITKVISSENLALMSINARKDKNHNAIAVVTVEISNQSQLEMLMNKIRSIPSTIEVFRTNY